MYKGCSGALRCNTKTYAKVHDNLTLTYNIQCCDTNLCNKKFYEMPKPGKPKGPLCPSCLQPNILKKCESKEKVRCLNKGDKCVTFSAIFEKPDNTINNYTIRGCASSMHCRLDAGKLVGVRVLQVGVFECKYPEELRKDGKKDME
ncbi:hypothetical protein GDO81_022189 [Engystomops pustulosus]|uniref:UPAR/Ly6 domain-containing protein n=1 Tax=Engystomops pustulosus TaxID=76066 RepID=A0AAV6ZM21_ENGPU|nr:hypothetical protein GDO81_022189 [Engystomops pustulosus]